VSEQHFVQGTDNGVELRGKIVPQLICSVEYELVDYFKAICDWGWADVWVKWGGWMVKSSGRLLG